MFSTERRKRTTSELPMNPRLDVDGMVKAKQRTGAVIDPSDRLSVERLILRSSTSLIRLLSLRTYTNTYSRNADKGARAHCKRPTCKWQLVPRSGATASAHAIVQRSPPGTPPPASPQTLVFYEAYNEACILFLSHGAMGRWKMPRRRFCFKSCLL